MRVGDVGEFALIEAIRERLARAAPAVRDDVRVGPGDDCAVVAPRPGRDLLFTTDEAIEGVHFERAWLEPGAIGRRAMTQSLSDIAAMAGEPRWAVLALALPPELPLEDAVALAGGAAERAAAHGCVLVGGNVTRSARLAASIAAVGDVEAGRALRRSGARVGDAIFVTGDPGLARAGLLALQAGRGAEDALAPAVERWRDPRPRIEEARFLRDALGARAMIDLSDGLAGDLAHIARASGVAVRIDAARLPVGAALARAAAALGRDARVLALEGGEDYEVAFTAPPGDAGAIGAELERRFGVGLTMIGEVVAGAGVAIEGAVDPRRARSFEHFRPTE